MDWDIYHGRFLGKRQLTEVLKVFSYLFQAKITTMNILCNTISYNTNTNNVATELSGPGPRIQKFGYCTKLN